MFSQNVDSILGDLLKALNYRRYIHTLGVAHTATLIGSHYDINLEKVALAGLLHDCAKELPPEELDMLVKESNLWNPADCSLPDHQGIKHAPAGGVLAQKKYGIMDPDVIDAITFHTTGHAHPSMLLKILMISDYLEPTREYSAQRKNLVQTAKYDLDTSLVSMLESKANHLIEVKKKSIHHLTKEMLSSL